MIERFLAIIEKLTELLRERERERREVFENLILPLFTEFERVAMDYLKFFYGFAALARKSEDWLQYVDILRSKAEEQRASRIQVSSMATALLNGTKDSSSADARGIALDLHWLLRSMTDFLCCKGYFDPNDSGFPSLSEVFAKEAEERVLALRRDGTWTALSIDVFEFLALQETYFQGQNSSEKRRHEFELYLFRVIRHLESSLGSAVSHYASMRLKTYGPKSLLKT